MFVQQFKCSIKLSPTTTASFNMICGDLENMCYFFNILFYSFTFITNFELPVPQQYDCLSLCTLSLTWILSLQDVLEQMAGVQCGQDSIVYWLYRHTFEFSSWAYSIKILLVGNFDIIIIIILVLLLVYPNLTVSVLTCFFVNVSLSSIQLVGSTCNSLHVLQVETEKVIFDASNFTHSDFDLFPRSGSLATVLARLLSWVISDFIWSANRYL